MARKPGLSRPIFDRKCLHCDFITKKNALLILHAKEEHGIEL